MRAAVALMLCAAARSPAGAGESYPSKPVRVLAPFPAGSGVDIVARMIGAPLSGAVGQSVVVDNRPGANGTIACELAARSAPDGYTLLLGNASTLAMAPGLYPRIAYDPVKSFAPITLIAHSANVLVVHPSVPAASVPALIALAKARPGQLNYGSAGSGNSTHLAAELFRLMSGANIVHVPYKGTPPMLTELLAGQIQLSFTSLVSSLPHIKQGRLRALGVTSLQRAGSLPELPTISEAGLKGYEVTVWQGIVAPAGTPQSIVGELNAHITRILKTADMRERFAVQGLEAAPGTPAQFGAYIAAEVAKWTKVIRQAGIVPD